jgi:hypothetical protein
MATLKKRIDELEGRSGDNEGCYIFDGWERTSEQLKALGARVDFYVPDNGRNPEVVAREKQQKQGEIAGRMAQQPDNQE